MNFSSTRSKVLDYCHLLPKYSYQSYESAKRFINSLKVELTDQEYNILIKDISDYLKV